MDAEQVLAFRFARMGLASRDAGSLAEAAACPASDFNRGAALLALAARAPDVSREAYDEAVDAGDLALAHVIRGAIHALDPGDHALYGRALLPREDDEVGHVLGQQVTKLAKEKGFSPVVALDEVAEATKDALAERKTLDKNELHEELRQRVNPDYMPWCRSCRSHHVAPLLWRYATVKAGARLDSGRRYRPGKPGRAAGSDAVRRYLGFYGPAKPGEFAEWAGILKRHAQRLWDEVASDLEEVPVGKAQTWLLHDAVAELESPPSAAGVRLLPPGDPYLQKPNRPLLARDDALRKRMFRPVASPGAVLVDGRLVGLWKAKAKGKKTEITVEKLGRFARAELEDEAQRLARSRGAAEAVVAIER